MSRKYRNRSNDNDFHTFIFLIILIGGILWSNQEIVNSAGQLVPLVILGISGIYILTQCLWIVARIRRWKRLSNPEFPSIDKMTGLEFEKYVARMLVNQGYRHVRLTEQYDMGIDIIAEKDGLRYGIQVKRYSGLVKASAVRQVITALKYYQCDKAIVITNSTYSRVAKQLADSNNCVLIDRIT